MLGVHNRVAADGLEILMGMQKLLAAAEHERSTQIYQYFLFYPFLLAKSRKSEDSKNLTWLLQVLRLDY
jgi:hypothetical protein